MQEFIFSFETDGDLYRAELTGYIESYDCVRMVVESSVTNSSVDFPLKTAESYAAALKTYEGQIKSVYQTVHSYDITDYVD